MTDKNKTTVSGGPPPVEKQQEMDGKRHKVSTTVGPEGGVGKPADRQFRIKEAKMISASNKEFLSAISNAEDIQKHKDGTHTFRRGFFYRHGSTSEGMATKLSMVLNGLGIKHDVVAHGTQDYKPFRGGASVRTQNHHWVKIRIHPNQKIENFLEESFLSEEGNFPPARLIGAGMKAAKKKHGIDPGMPYKELKAKHPEVAKTGWRIAHVFWRKEKADARKSKKKTVKEARVLNFQQRLKRSRQIKKLAPKLNRGRVRFQYTSPNSSRLLKRSERLARSIVKQRFSPVKGKSYSQLSTSQKIMVDTLVARKQNMIKKLAVRLLPKVRQKAMKRISSFHKNDVDLKIQNLGSHPLAESLNTINALASGKDNKAVIALREKARKANVEFDKILEVYYDAIAEYDPETSKITAEQYAFNAVNVFVTEQINMIAEGLFSSMFIPPTTRLAAALSGPRIPPNHSVRVERDVVDENRRSKAVHSYATSEFKKQSKGRYRPNGAFGTKSYEVRTDANIINKQHSEMLRDKDFLKTEYRVGNREFAIRKFGKTAKLPDHHVNKLLDFDNHYHNVTEEYVDEAISIKSHAGKREVDNGKVHDLKDHGGKPYGQLQRVATYKSPSNDLYKLMMPNGQVFKGNGTKPVVKTKQEWENHLNDVEKKHKERMGISENMFMAPPWADPLAIAGEIVKTTGVKNAIPVVTKVVGDSVKEKGKKTISALRARAKANKERDYD